MALVINAPTVVVAICSLVLLSWCQSSFAMHLSTVTCGNCTMALTIMGGFVALTVMFAMHHTYIGAQQLLWQARATTY